MDLGNDEEESSVHEEPQIEVPPEPVTVIPPDNKDITPRSRRVSNLEVPETKTRGQSIGGTDRKSPSPSPGKALKPPTSVTGTPFIHSFFVIGEDVSTLKSEMLWNKLMILTCFS